jgi:hypothetical protein
LERGQLDADEEGERFRNRMSTIEEIGDGKKSWVNNPSVKGVERIQLGSTKGATRGIGDMTQESGMEMLGFDAGLTSRGNTGRFSFCGMQSDDMGVMKVAPTSGRAAGRFKTLCVVELLAERQGDVCFGLIGHGTSFCIRKNCPHGWAFQCK